MNRLADLFRSLTRWERVRDAPGDDVRVRHDLAIDSAEVPCYRDQVAARTTDVQPAELCTPPAHDCFNRAEAGVRRNPSRGECAEADERHNRQGTADHHVMPETGGGLFAGAESCYFRQ